MPALPFKPCWSFQTKVLNPYVASDNVKGIVFSALDGKLLALESMDGVKLWETDLGGVVVSDLINEESQKSIFVITKPFSVENTKDRENVNNFPVVPVKIRSIDKNTGITDWQTSLSVSLSNTQKLFTFIYENKIIVADQNGGIVALNDIDGEILWKRNLNMELSDFYFDVQSKNFIILSKNRIILTLFETGKTVFLKETKSILTGAYIFNKNILILGDKKGQISAIDIQTQKQLWKSRVGAEVSNINLTPKGVLVTSLDNFIYLFIPQSGKLLWKRRLEGRLVIEPYLLDNSVIVMTLGSPKAIVFNLNKGEPVNKIILDADNYFINRPVFNNQMIVFPTTYGIFTYTNSDNKCAAE